MNRYHHQRLLIENLRPEEDIYYLTNNGGVELKRPNIISRRNNSKVQVMFNVQSTTASTPLILPVPVHDRISYVETYDPGELTIVPDTVPLELLSTDSFIVSEATFPVVSELSLTLEPTVVSQPLPNEIPLTYDSTCVSQAISTPIVTPIVSSSGLPSEYITANTPSSFHVYCNGQDLLQLSNESDELGVPIEVVGEMGAGISSLYMESAVSTSECETATELTFEEDQVISSDGDDESASMQNQMRIETQADGSFVLYLEGPMSSEAIDIVSEAEIIQTDMFPVLPNVPVELPSQKDGGGTESFILVPIDAQGNTVLVPTSSVMRTRLTPRKLNARSTHTIGHSNVSPRISELEKEKPKPFRYDLPEEIANDPYMENSVMTSLNLSSSLVPNVYSTSINVEAEEADHLLQKSINKNQGGAAIIGRTEPPKPKEKQSDKYKNETESAEAGIIERTSLGIFKCKFCSRETRLKVLMLNHIKRSHKTQDLNTELLGKTVLEVIPNGCKKSSNEQTLKLENEEQNCAERHFTLVSSSSLFITQQNPHLVSSITSTGTDATEIRETLSPEETDFLVSEHNETMQNQITECSNEILATNVGQSRVDCASEVVNGSAEFKRKRVLLSEYNPKLKKVAVEPILLKSQSPSPRKYPSKSVKLSSTKVTPAPMRMRTRSHSGGERCLRNSHQRFS